MRDHPIIENMESTGYPDGKVPKYHGEDSRQVEIYQGDLIIEYDGFRFVKDDLSYDAIEILEMIGAETYEQE